MSPAEREAAAEEAAARAEEVLGARVGALRRELWRTDPIGWVGERLGERAWSAQVAIAESVRDHRHTAVRACHDSGKSWVASRLAAWWIDTHPLGEAFVVTSAPSLPQVRAILWRELAEAHRRGGLAGQMNQMDWSIDGRLVAFGRKPSDYDRAAFQGIHAPAVLVILDEASGIPEPLWTAAETLVANEGSRLLAIGNPDDPTSAFAGACRAGSGWSVIGISAFETPNLTGEEVPRELGAGLVSGTWIEERRARWGEGSPLWQAKVLGCFPEVTEDALIPLAWVERARERELEEAGEVSLGVDVARFGTGETVIMALRGPVARLVSAHRGEDTAQTTGRVIQAMRETGAGEVRIDEVGVGGGVVDSLREQGYGVRGLNAGAAPADPSRFANARAEWYWALRDRFERGQIDIDPDDEVLAEQLASLRYRPNSRGRTQIESKDQMRARGLPSPDRADALMLAAAVVPEPEGTWILVYDNPRVQISPF